MSSPPAFDQSVGVQHEGVAGRVRHGGLHAPDDVDRDAQRRRGGLVEEDDGADMAGEGRRQVADTGVGDLPAVGVDDGPRPGVPKRTSID